ncbi:bifunctional 3-(3-hydroxy-phenyl)propionate/3-hydroxycinnamic acid hydroxylase [Pseudonocardia endophytica]|uniref:3-(3-hydroxy-phenyl)propionate hydroxylase n=1 Tax=Pseudonocardia endophytica TaxID=401976 RepID=A0A4R1I166_PSEEN|nr:bifunctional 3-(3-hydroxy-phenyl)propionate/3-hydroxycinnamic acid hydroxylase [Pseudonocardia endophytica]TCK27643.1 3-(3-hydroxy-phenyl)propionate hydroxylase [Pseudonocardia endophytica]
MSPAASNPTGPRGEAPDYDVAIVGYGPVGVTAANLLGAMGLRVLVVERDTDVYARARAISTDEEVVRIWQRIGLADTLTADMLADRELTFVDADGRTFLAFTPQPVGNGHPTQLFIYQPALERTLREGATRYPNVDVRLGHDCVGIAQDDDGVELSVRPAGPVDAAATPAWTCRSSYVIAADGGSSAIRSCLGIGFEGRTYTERWVVIDTKVRRPWPEVDRLRFHCDPERPAVDCPTPLGHHRWEFPVQDGDDEQRLTSTDGVYELLAHQGIGPEHVEILRAVIYSHHVRFADRWRDRRVFLAGDAAHVMPPWLGQGMASGVRDVDNLCWKLATALDPQLPDTTRELLLDSYEAERMPHVRSITRAAVFFGRVITERRPGAAAVRDHAFRTICRLPGVGAFLQNGGWFPTTRYRTGLLGQAHRRRGPARETGTHLPQPWVLDQHGHRTRLDDALGHTEWAVLHTRARTGTDLDAWRRAGIPLVELRPAGSDPGPGAVVDIENVLITRFARAGVSAAAIRPDAIVYAAAGTRCPLPPPLGGMRAVDRPAAPA